MKPLLAILAVIAGSSLGCGRDEILSVDPEQAPGRSTPTLESLLEPAGSISWIDTVFSGFGKASNSTFILVEGSANVISRGLVRFLGPVQDTVFSADTVSEAQSFDSLRLVLGLDTTRTVLASGGTTLQLLAVEEDWDVGSADWVLAVDSPGVSIPWSAGPGGSLGFVMSELTLEEKPDSLVFDLTQYSDSLLRAWNDTTQENKGLAVVVADSGHVIAGDPRLFYNVIPALTPDTAVLVRCPSTTSLLRCFVNKTYIFDEDALPPVSGVLRIGGVDGWRSFTEIVVPDSLPVDGFADPVPLRGGTVNKAELVLRSLAPPPPPFEAEAAFSASSFELADAFTVVGPKTPVGRELFRATFDIDPGVLDTDSLVVVDLTELLQRWVAVPLDSMAPPVRFSLRARPEGTTFGFWEFGAADAEPAFRPVLRIVFTPRAEFGFP